MAQTKAGVSKTADSREGTGDTEENGDNVSNDTKKKEEEDTATTEQRGTLT